MASSRGSDETRIAGEQLFDSLKSTSQQHLNHRVVQVEGDGYTAEQAENISRRHDSDREGFRVAFTRHIYYVVRASLWVIFIGIVFFCAVFVWQNFRDPDRVEILLSKLIEWGLVAASSLFAERRISKR